MESGRIKFHLNARGRPRRQCHILIVSLLALLLSAGCRREAIPSRVYEDVPLRSAAELEVVAALGQVLGNIAVSPSGRIFITYHPEGTPAVKVAEILPGNRSRPYPDGAWQRRFESPQGIQLDAKGRLWVLDHGRNGFGKPALYGFDADSGTLVHEFVFGSEHGVGWGSHLNDLSVDAARDYVYIADTSSYRMNPALVVYDVNARRARRVLEGHRSVAAEQVDMTVEGRTIKFLFIPIRIGVDSIVLDLANDYLYYGPLSGTRLYRVPTAALRDPRLSSAALAAAVEDWGPKPISDGITIDREGNVYLTAIEERAVALLRPPGQRDAVAAAAAVAVDARSSSAGQHGGGAGDSGSGAGVRDDEDTRRATMVRDPRLIWPDGLSFGPDGWVYVTDSQLNRVLFRSKRAIERLGPHYIYRFRALTEGLPGR